MARCDTVALVRAVKAAGMRCSGNYMIGYPDETEAEIGATLDMAWRHRDAGIDEADVFCVVPFPGTTLYDKAIRRGWLPADWNPDDMRWFRPIMRNVAVPAARLQAIRDAAWADLNPPAFVTVHAEAAR